ncbi:hypothetical protein PILCRDRAFT_815271 [Piloderma croceum F 1598]|uniref:Uncharacterized protein n=1 Tax=Piloderma croceum (strain F 1598) TaxID=765440 RepID=A0A0C3G7F6_PILCF|nr:hypothetical protein PILCRDRAFT_815271 [Piloderma croceum F 1598]
MSDEWGETDAYDPWNVPEQQPESETPVAKPSKEKKAPRDRKPLGERKPPKEKQPAAAEPTPPGESAEAEAAASGDAWGTEDVYDPWATPAENTEQEAPVSKPPRAKKSAERKAPAERKPPRERKPTAENKSAAGDATSTGDAPTSPAAEAADSPPQDEMSNEKKKSQAYHNPERVLTGGSQRDKLSEEELTERMTRMREQNEKIKQRRMDVIADEDAFKKTQEFERLKQEKIRKEQEHVNRTREQNARRKMDKISSREWDEGKPSGEWKQGRKQTQDGSDNSPSAESSSRGRGGGGRGGISSRGRSRGRGGGGSEVAAKSEEQAQSSLASTSEIA